MNKWTSEGGTPPETGDVCELRHKKGPNSVCVFNEARGWFSYPHLFKCGHNPITDRKVLTSMEVALLPQTVNSSEYTKLGNKYE